MSPERLDQLVDAWMDGSLSPTEQEELNHILEAEPGTARRAQEQLRTTAQLEALLAPQADCSERVSQALARRETGRSRRNPRRTSGHRRPLLFWLAATAAVLVLGCSWLLLGRMPTAELVEGHLIGLATGDRVPSGSLVTADGAALLRLPDGSRLHLSPATRLRLLALDPGSQRLHLDAGRVAAEVEHQQPGTHLAIATDDLEVIVIGTRFSLEKRADDSTLAVQEGRVRCRAGTQEREVGAGGSLRAGPAGLVPLRFLQGDPAIRVLAGAPAGISDAGPACLVGGAWKNTPGMDAVVWEWPRQAPVSFGPELVLRARIRCAPGTGSLGMVAYSNGRSANFGWDLPHPRTGEWFDLNLPLSGLHPYKKDEAPLKPGDPISMLILWVDRSAPQALLIDDLRIESDRL